MTPSEVAKIKKGINPSSLSTIYGCYIDDSGQIKGRFEQKLDNNTLGEGAVESILKCLRKGISGAMGRNLIEIDVPKDMTGYKVLNKLRDSECNDQDENLDYYTEKGAREMVLAQTTYCSVGMWGHSSKIMERIARAFAGGWIEDNDCKGMPPRWVSGSDAPSFFFHRIDMLSGGYCLLVARAQGIVDKFPALSYVGDSFVLAAPKYSKVEANVAKTGKEMLSFFGKGFSHVDAAKICEMCKDFAFVYVPDKDAFVLPATMTSDGVHAYMDYLSKKMVDKGLTAAAEALNKYATATITE